MDSFRILRERDEAAHETFKTKETVLEIYDEMAEVIAANAAAKAADKPATAQYQTHLDPPPGPPTDADGNFIPMSQWDAAIWQRYKNVIHPPKEQVEVPDFDIAAIAGTTYPLSADEVICAAAAEVIEQAGQLSSMDHLDALLLVTHPEWCRVFLGDPDIVALDRAIADAPQNLFVTEGTAIQWNHCCKYLEQHKAIQVAHGNLPAQPITADKDLAKLRATLPGGTETVVSLALKALERVCQLREQLDVTAKGQKLVMEIFQQKHTEYALTGTEG